MLHDAWMDTLLCRHGQKGMAKLIQCSAFQSEQVAMLAPPLVESVRLDADAEVIANDSCVALDADRGTFLVLQQKFRCLSLEGLHEIFLALLQCIINRIGHRKHALAGFGLRGIEIALIVV